MPATAEPASAAKPAEDSKKGAAAAASGSNKDKEKSSKSKPAAADNGEPTPVAYATPFPFHGIEHVESGRVYRLPAKDDFVAFRTFADSLDGFTLRHNDKESRIMVWTKKIPDESMHVIKVFGVFTATKENPKGGCKPAELYDMLQDAVFREEWDGFRQEAFRIVKLSDNADIGYYAGKSPMPMVANRDFVNQRMWHDAGRGEYVIFNTSVPHSAVAPTYQKDVHKNKYGTYIRAISKLTGYLVRPWINPETGVEEGSSMTYITQTDPCGWIPTSLTNYISTKYAPNTILNVAKAIHQFQEWFPKQLAAGTYDKDWDGPSEWWNLTEEEEQARPIRNETIEFAREKWGLVPPVTSPNTKEAKKEKK